MAVGLAAIVVMGVSGAGKSTVGKLVAARLSCPFRDADSFHPKANIEKMSRGEPLTDEDRWPWLRAIAAWIAEHRAAGTVCVVTCSALKRAYRDIVTNKQSADVRLVYLKGDFDLIEARLKARKGHFMPPGLLRSQFAALEEPATGENAITVLIDATPEEIAGEVLNLREHGVVQDQAEAHAEDVRQFVMSELVTKQDLTLALDNVTLKLTVRLGAMLAAGIAVLGAVIKLA